MFQTTKQLFSWNQNPHQTLSSTSFKRKALILLKVGSGPQRFEVIIARQVYSLQAFQPLFELETLDLCLDFKLLWRQFNICNIELCGKI
jgi:hypothetical protein